MKSHVYLDDLFCGIGIGLLFSKYYPVGLTIIGLMLLIAFMEAVNDSWY